MSSPAVPIIGIDTGGTFTDFVLHDGVRVRTHKELSTPDAPERAILAGLRALGVLAQDARIVHGSTVATNAVLEGKGAHTVFITNYGFGDLLTIGRQARAALYDLTPPPPPVPVPADHCLETGGRFGAHGEVVEDLSVGEMVALRRAVAALAPEAVAVCLLFAFQDDRFERRIGEVLASLPSLVCLSSEVLPEVREYERGMATWLNAYVGPLMQRYLTALASQVAPARLSVMQSSGLSAAPDFAARHGVHLLLSGPAGGLLGARHVANLVGCERLLTFDMGGTSTDVALIDGELSLSAEGKVGPYPVAVPMVDMHTIGAGGGSLARVDAAGLLHVGPQSAGAAPGPACYGLGGEAATVTDANVVLGRLPAGLELGGRLRIDADAAHAAVARIAEAMGGLSVAAAARGIVAIANDHMQQALRVISVERGVDPRDYTLVSFGGAGGLHVCALAAALAMTRALVPAQAGVLSALGMVVARPGRHLSHTLRCLLASLSETDVLHGLERLARGGCDALLAEGHERASLRVRYAVDICYRGQSHALTLPWSDHDTVAAAFRAEHLRRYGHTLERALEVVNLRVAVDVELAAPDFSAVADEPLRLPSTPAAGTLVYEQGRLAPGQPLAGPAIVLSAVATTYIESGWLAHADAAGNLHLSRPTAAS
ncbi:MAG: hydantoinase/oxoprolinase family protein [Gammaproteobacteria bacterium]|nr:hydantoinase/oxoprolinase family protein [Gammaproteobacteria bacterium]